MMQQLIQAVLEVPLFKDLKASQVMDIVNAAERVVYQPGQTITQRQTIGRASVLLVSGYAVRVQGPDVSSETGVSAPERISSGTLIGELAMFIDVEHFSTVLAETQVKAMRLTQPIMHALMERDPELADQFVGQISGQLQSMAEEMRAIDQTLHSGPTGFGELFADLEAGAARAQSQTTRLH